MSRESEASDVLRGYPAVKMMSPGLKGRMEKRCDFRAVTTHS
jgi:hypothetical protein